MSAHESAGLAFSKGRNRSICMPCLAHVNGGATFPTGTLRSASSCLTLPSWGLIKVPLLLPRLPTICCRQGKEAISQSTTRLQCWHNAAQRGCS